MPYEAEEINDFSKFMEMEREWNDLLSNNHSDIPFLRHEWFRNWWHHFGSSNRLALIVVRRRGELVFALPLMEIKSFFGGLPFTTLQSVTNRHSFRYDFLLKKGEDGAVRVAIDYLSERPRRWDMLLLEEVPSDSSAYKQLLNAARVKSFKTGIWLAYDSPFIEVNGKWDDYLSTLKSKFRSNLRNRTKRLQQNGGVTVETLASSSDIDRILNEGFDIERRSWKGEKGSAIVCDPIVASFYIEWAGIAAKNDWLRLSILRVGERGAAFDYSISYKERLFCMKIGYDPEFRPYSVGQILCSEILKRGFDDGIKEYDFLGEMTEQKNDWMPLSRNHVWLFVYSGTLRSRIHYIYKFRLKQSIKRWFN